MQNLKNFAFLQSEKHPEGYAGCSESELSDSAALKLKLTLFELLTTMFDFEKLTVYKKAKGFHRNTQKYLLNNAGVDRIVSNQLKRAALSISLNLAEGSGRFTKPDRRNFFVIARSSVFECVVIFDILKEEDLIQEDAFADFYADAEELSKILFAMIKNLQ